MKIERQITKGNESEKRKGVIRTQLTQYRRTDLVSLFKHLAKFRIEYSGNSSKYRAFTFILDFVFVFLDYVDVQQPLKIKKRNSSIDIENKIIDQEMILSGNEIISHTDTNASTSASYT